MCVHINNFYDKLFVLKLNFDLALLCTLCGRISSGHLLHDNYERLISHHIPVIAMVMVATFVRSLCVTRTYNCASTRNIVSCPAPFAGTRLRAIQFRVQRHQRIPMFFQTHNNNIINQVNILNYHNVRDCRAFRAKPAISCCWNFYAAQLRNHSTFQRRPRPYKHQSTSTI